MENVVLKKWKDINVGDIMPDGSVVTQIHQAHFDECFKLTAKCGFKKSTITVSQDHLFLTDLSSINKKFRKEIFDQFRDQNIPVEEIESIFTDRELNEEEKQRISDALTSGNSSSISDIIDSTEIFFTSTDVSKTEPYIYNEDKNLIWLSALDINALFKNKYKVKIGNSVITECEYVGQKECRCISTNTGKYSTKSLSDKHGDFNLLNYDFIHHNSVTIRNVIFHCVTHGIKIGLVDLKLTEFTPWKGHENVLGVANSVREAAELLRIARQLMYKRNAELAKAGVVDLADYKPKRPTNKITIFGREYNEDEICIVKDPETGEDKEMTVKEVLEFLNS